MPRSLLGTAAVLAGILLSFVPSRAAASTWNGEPKLVLHVKALTVKNACSWGNLMDARQANTRADLFAPYFVYLLGARGDSPGILGIRTGLTFDSGLPSQLVDGLGVDVFNWRPARSRG